MWHVSKSAWTLLFTFILWQIKATQLHHFLSPFPHTKKQALSSVPITPEPGARVWQRPKCYTSLNVVLGFRSLSFIFTAQTLSLNPDANRVFEGSLFLLRWWRSRCFVCLWSKKKTSSVPACIPREPCQVQDVHALKIDNSRASNTFHQMC